MQRTRPWARSSVLNVPVKAEVTVVATGPPGHPPRTVVQHSALLAPHSHTTGAGRVKTLRPSLATFLVQPFLFAARFREVLERRPAWTCRGCARQSR